MNVHEIPIGVIVIGERQRKDMGDIDSLRLSIEQKGLIQPIVVSQREDGRYDLVAGGRRLAACTELGWENIAASTREELDPLTRRELELEENLRRKDILWHEEVAASAEIHRLKREKYSKSLPGRFGRGGWNQKDTAKELDVSEGKISQDLLIAEEMEKHPELINQRTRKEALRAIRHIEAVGYVDESAVLKKLKDCFIQEPHETFYQRMEPAIADLIVTDITHQSYNVIIPLIARTLKLTGNAYLFFPLETFHLLMESIKLNRLITKPKPMIWHIRGEDSYVTFLWCSRAMANPPRYINDHQSHRKDPNAFHTLAKPYQLFYNLIENSTLKGHFVIDPSTYDLALVRVCLDLGRSILANCPIKSVYDQCILEATKKVQE